MEKDNKYYGIIENLVRTHRKFNGYEPILDDIIDDVFKHAKSVINSVKDEDVVASYLQKLVSVSIITVPRRMNFHSELSHRTISPSVSDIIKEKPVVAHVETVSAETEPFVPAEPEIHEEPEIKANVQFVDNMINSIDTASVLDNQEDNSTDELTDITNSEAFETEDLSDDLTEVLSPAEDDGVAELDLGDITLSEETENSVDMQDTPAEEEVSETDDAIDLFPVSDEISEAEQDDFSLEEELSVEEEDVEVLPEEPEVSENTQTDLLSEEPETFENLQTDLLSEDEPSDINIGMELQEDENLLAEENSAPEIEDFSNPDTMLSDEQEEISPEEISVIDSEAEIFDDNNEVETLEPDMPGDDVVELDLNNDSFELSENSIDGAIDADTIQLQEEPSDIPYFGDEQDIQLAASTEGDELTLEDNDMSIGLYAEEGQEETLTAVKEKAEPVFKSVDYSLFSFAPEEKTEDVDVKSIETKLAELNKQKPELNILKVFELRYKQNLPIANIAAELQLEKGAVIAALDEIVELI